MSDKKYVLVIPELYYSKYIIDAESEAEALNKFIDGGADLLSDSPEYEEIIEPDEMSWGVKEDGKATTTMYMLKSARGELRWIVTGKY